MPETVLLVGHCVADQTAFRRWLSPHFELSFLSADSIDEAIRQIEQQDVKLVLANRVFEFTGEEGIDLIRRLHESPAPPAPPATPPPGPRCILVSNYADAQTAAQQAGALPGFGKSTLQTAAALQAVREGLN